MDEEIRKKAHAKISNAHSLERKQVPNQKIIDEYMQAIQLFLTIQKKTTDDLKHLAESYYDLATFYFNKMSMSKQANVMYRPYNNCYKLN